MATQNKYLTEIFPNTDSTFVNNNRFNNLNLNYGHVCSEERVDTSKFSSLKCGKGSEYQERDFFRSNTSSFAPVETQQKMWNTDETISLKKLKLPQPSFERDKKSASTLSLHIAAYEAATELMNQQYEDDYFLSKPEKSKLELKKKLQRKIRIKNAYEFPRQQEDAVQKPEIMQFKASQQLLKPAQEGPSLKKQRTSYASDKDFSSPPPPSSSPSSSSTSTLPSHSTRSTSKPPLIKILSFPSTPTSSRPRFIAPTKPTVSMDWENYQDPDPEINKFAEEQKRKEAEPPKPPEPPKPAMPPKSREEELLEEIARLKGENASLHGELNTAKHYISNKKYRERQAKMKSEEEKNAENDENKEEKDFQDLPKTTRNRIINEIWDKLQTKHSPNMAAQIISAVYQRKVQAEETSLTPAQTLQVLKDSGISIEALRKIRSSLNKFDVPNPFASDRAVNKERAQIHETVKFKKETVLMSNTSNGPKVETDVYYRESVYDELQERIDGIISAGNYEPFYVDGEEVIAAVLTKDKATEYSKFCMGIGNTKAPINSPRGLSLLAYFKANDSQENIYAAYDRENGIGPQVDNIKEITVTINGETKTLPVKWFVTGDFEFLNAIAGLNSNSCSFPCWNCEQKSETTYGELDMNLKAAKREPKIDPSKSQIREPLFRSIPFERFIPPVLHITLGPGTQLFEALCERAREMDNTGIETTNVPELLQTDKAKKSWESTQEKIEKLQATLERLNHQKSLFDENNVEAANACQSPNCVAIRDGKNVNKIYEIDRFCYQCQLYFHKSCLYHGTCPHCAGKYPTPKQSQNVIDQDRKDIDKEIKQTSKLLKEEEDKIAAIVSKFKLGSLAKNMEQVFQKHGGSRKLFFQSFTGKQLTAMGRNITAIYFDFDEKLQADEKIQKIIRAIVKFFNIRKLLTTKRLETSEIDEIETKIQDYASYMKDNLPDFRVLHKGHTLLKHFGEFMRKFKIAGYFSDEAIESYHVIFNKYDKRIGNRGPDKYAELMFKYNKEDTFLHDRGVYMVEEE